MKRKLFFLAAGFVFLSCSKEDGFKLTTDFDGKFVFINSPNPNLNIDEVFTLDKDGLKQVTSTDTIGFAKSDPVWIKDGQYIQYEEFYVCWCPSFGRNKIIKSDGSDARTFHVPFISPDNQYGCVYNFVNLYLYSLDYNLKNMELMDSILNMDAFKPVKWAPDSKQVLCVIANNMGNKLVSYNILSKKVTNLFSFDENIPGITHFDWSYLGDNVAFIWQDDVYVVNADGTNVQNLTSSPNIEYAMAWSPTEDVLAYSERTLDDKMDNIILHDFTDSMEHSLDLVQQLNEYVFQIQWSAEGKSIAFSAGSERYGIFIIDKDGTNLKQIHDQYVSSFDWYAE